MLPVIPHLMRNPGNIGKGNTHKRHFSGPRIAVRGDTVLDAVSRKYPGGKYPAKAPQWNSPD